MSRGELVEIGGSFRIPDVLRKGGARLREVGTTNRTRLADYRARHRARDRPDPEGAPEQLPDRGLHGGSRASRTWRASPARPACRSSRTRAAGSSSRLPEPLAHAEPTVAQSLRAGVDVVTFSGDKLLGGPQAGLLAGRRALVEAMRRNPLYRALRVDKMTLAALDAVLLEHEAGRAADDVPVLRMLALTPDAVRARAEALATGLRVRGAGSRGRRPERATRRWAAARPRRSGMPTALLALIHRSASADRLAAAPAGRRAAGDRARGRGPRARGPPDGGAGGRACSSSRARRRRERSDRRLNRRSRDVIIPSRMIRRAVLLSSVLALAAPSAFTQDVVKRVGQVTFRVDPSRAFPGRRDRGAPLVARPPRNGFRDPRRPPRSVLPRRGASRALSYPSP